jgi:hypothetical protein
VTADDTLYRLDDQGWTKYSSPVKGPRALWGDKATAIWIAGDGGAGFFDGNDWRLVAGAPKHLRAVVGQGRQVWLGGPSGLWHGQAPAPKKPKTATKPKPKAATKPKPKATAKPKPKKS